MEILGVVVGWMSLWRWVGDGDVAGVVDEEEKAKQNAPTTWASHRGKIVFDSKFQLSGNASTNGEPTQSYLNENV